MMHRIAKHLARFGRKEDGHATIEFAIMFPFFFVFILSSVEIGLITLKYAFLERGLDIAVREVRLSTGDAPDHVELKNLICDEATFIDNCAENLSLEMVQVDPRNWVPISDQATCTDRAEEVQPVTTFTPGQANQLMILRVCAKVPALYPTMGFGKEIAKDTSGDIALVSVSAFVQEPS
ncbi:TadE/TadG family type IV pilus assembly protein [Shimia biformata]|uniref:TadE/TadG family type IV pilus assembly protein n=1 Tax=Shimia biformata TaxID=1294299 RepID=UPI00194DEF08|nr:TadE/TadG family type IV pilus assembly protein [Shimia biformata]